MARGRGAWGAPLAVFVCATAYFAAFVPYGFYLEDEGLILYHILRTLRGQLPYIDFHTGYAPGLFYANALLLRLFGVDVVPIRCVLALVNGAGATLVFVLAREIAPVRWALAGTVAYVGFLPFFGGEFASFNIPYPCWYITLAWLTSTVCLLRAEASGKRRWLALAGAAAGACFDFKPNGGVFAVAAGMLAILVLGTAPRALAAAALAAFAVFVAILFGFSPLSFETAIFFVPWIALAAFVVRRTLGGDGRLGRTPVRDLGVFLLGAAVPTVPWLAYLATVMPVHDFLREVLLIGGGVQEAYWTPYPLPEWWALVLFIFTGAAAAAALGLRTERVAPRTVALAAAAAVVATATTFVLFARMPEGLLLSVVWQLENASFYLVPAALGAAIWWLMRATALGAPATRRVMILLIAALAMLEQMNPRMDFMHLVMGVPASIPVLAFLGARLERAWRRHGRMGTAVAAVALAVPFGIAAVRIVGNLERTVDMEHAAGVIRLDERAGGRLATFGVEPEAGYDLAALRRVVDFIEKHTAPTDPLFGFPALTAVNFLSGRDSPVRHDYFFPGRPSHVDEAQVVATLAAVPPPYVVTLNDRFGFFHEAPAYYLMLRDWLVRHYVLELRIGRHDVLRRRDRPPDPVDGAPAVGEAAVFGGTMAARLAAIDDLGAHGTAADVPGLIAALYEVHRTLRTRVGAAIVAIADREGGLRAMMGRIRPRDRDELLFMRSLADAGDVRVLDYLTVRFAKPPSRRIRAEAAHTLGFATGRLLAERHLIAPDAAGRSPVIALRVPPHTLKQWLRDRFERLRIGAFAAIALGMTGRRGAAPLIRSMLAEKKSGWLQAAAGRALVDLRVPSAPCDLVGLMGVDDMAIQDHVPSMFLEATRWAPERCRTCLARGLASDEPRLREVSAWTAGVWRDPALVEPLVAAAARHGETTELAALWALGEIGDARADGIVTAALASGDLTVRAFAREAERKLVGGLLARR